MTPQKQPKSIQNDIKKHRLRLQNLTGYKCGYKFVTGVCAYIYAVFCESYKVTKFSVLTLIYNNKII